MPFLAECMGGDGCNVTLMCRGSFDRSIRPAHDISTLNLRHPPSKGIRGENSGAEKRPFDAGINDTLLYALTKNSERIWLLKKRMRRLVRCGQIHNSTCMSGDPLDNRVDCLVRYSPDQKHRVYSGQRGLQRFGIGQVASINLNSCRLPSVFRRSCECSNVRAGITQLRHEFATDDT